jgi:hypothetical protein
MARRDAAKVLGAVVLNASSALARDITGRNTVRVLADVTRGHTTVLLLAQCVWDRAMECMPG